MEVKCREKRIKPGLSIFCFFVSVQKEKPRFMPRQLHSDVQKVVKIDARGRRKVQSRCLAERFEDPPAYKAFRVDYTQS